MMCMKAGCLLREGLLENVWRGRENTSNISCYGKLREIICKAEHACKILKVGSKMISFVFVREDIQAEIQLLNKIARETRP